MNRVVRSTVLLGLATVVNLSAGCAAVSSPSPESPERAVVEQPSSREAAAIYDRLRDQAQFRAALNRRRAGDLVGCRELLQKLQARNPGHRESKLLLAELRRLEQPPESSPPAVDEAMQSPNWEAAATDAPHPARAVGHVVPSSPSTGLEAAFEQAEAAFVADDQPRARRCLEQAILHDPQNPQIPVRAAILALRFEQAALAEELLTSAAVQFPHSAAIQRTLGTARYRLGDYPAARSALQQALSLDNACGLSYFLMGCTLEKLGQSESAKWHFEQAGRLDPRFLARS